MKVGWKLREGQEGRVKKKDGIEERETSNR